MCSLRLGPGPADFVWAGGIENTFVPQTRPGHRALDEYVLMGHYTHWREDLARVKETGLNLLRWGVPWYRVEPLPGEFDWRWTDQVIPDMVEELGINAIIDVMHYGCPYWLRKEFANPDYPQALATYSAAFAERYKDLITWYTPTNEPLVTAELCGRGGAWPPYLTGDRGYVRVMLQIARGIIATVNAIKEVDPRARMMHVEASGLSRAGHPSLEAMSARHRLRGFLCLDLVTGRIIPDHPVYEWLVQRGGTPPELEQIADSAIPIDVMGLNFYPQWSTNELYLDAKGKISHRCIEKDGAGFGAMLADYYTRYGAPIVITETSAKNSDEERSAWLRSSLSQIKSLRAAGVPVLGYTWFPVFTMIDWKYRWNRRPLS